MIDWSAVAAEEALPGITRQTVQGDSVTVVRYLYAPGAVFPVHSHPEEQVTVVHAGRIRFSMPEGETEVGPGGVLRVPSGVPHGARVVGHEAVESVNVLAPRRTAHLRVATA